MDIRLKQISIQFNKKTIFSNLNVTFEEGCINCLMGQSGKGKTTILNLIMGFVKPDRGEILFDQEDRIAAVFQDDRLIEQWDALKNVKLVCGRKPEEEQIIRELMKIGIDDYKGKPVKNFSEGMRRRVAIVRALIASSDIVLLDEPFRGLDSKLKGRVIDYIKEKTKGKTVIVVTHEIEDVMQLEGNLVTLDYAK